MSEKGRPPITCVAANKPYLKSAALLAAALSLAACSDSSSRGPSYQTGVLIDAPVEGVGYSTVSETGVTNSAGEFRYQTGETVTFTLGSVELGQAAGASEVTVFDLAGVESVPSGIDEFYEAMYQPDGQPTPLMRATNIGILLQSLDDDANPDNGISIDPNVAALITPEQIDLTEDVYSFRIGGNGRNGLGLPRIIRDAAAAGDLSARGVVGIGAALDHLAEQAGVDFGIEANQLYTSDNNADGNIDYRREITFASNGRVATDEYDFDGDGALDRANRYLYSDEQLETRYTSDNDGDGADDSIRTTEYDAFGAMTRRQTTDGSGAVTNLEVIEYDEVGRMIRRENGGATNRTVEFWRIDENGLRSTYELDTDGDGTIDRRDLLSYPAGEVRSDRWTGRDIDRDLDGIVDGTQERSLDALGRITRDFRDDDLDGTPEYELLQTYGDYGPTEQSVLSGTVRRTTSWTYDAEGKRIRYTYDSDGDGSPNRITEYQYDANGNSIGQTRDSDGDGNVDSTTTYLYDSEGRNIGYESDSDADGTPDAREIRTFDPQGRRVRREYDRGADGTIDIIDEYSNWIAVSAGYAI
ncbi:MAG: hypothetical protein NXH85_00465 [Pseudomonadaceae bacterium]|nr:hypothetical protein [Pseudomonadaceae bacterium]